MCYEKIMGPTDGACLVFAHNVREALRLAHPILSRWWDGYERTDGCADLLRGKHMYLEADQAKLAAGIPHVIERPKVCAICQHWGFRRNKLGICESCLDEMK